MKKNLLLTLLLLPSLAFSQIDSTVTLDTTYWNTGGKFGVSFNQATLKNWSAGGASSIAGSAYFNYIFDYEKEDVIWGNSIDLGIGYIKEEVKGQTKADDRIVFTSSFGKQLSKKQTNKKWLYNISIDFRTQFAEGNSPDSPDGKHISKFMAPGYLLTSIGINWRQSDNFNVSLNPVSSKLTFVYDDYLSSIGSFGVDSGSHIRTEFGANLAASFNKEIFKNVEYTSNLLLFTNYLKNPDKVDVNWENILTMKVNRFLSANIYNQFIYDYDIKFDITDDNGNTISTEDRWQYKMIIGIGISVSFGGSRG